MCNTLLGGEFSSLPSHVSSLCTPLSPVLYLKKHKTLPVRSPCLWQPQKTITHQGQNIHQEFSSKAIKKNALHLQHSVLNMSGVKMSFFFCRLSRIRTEWGGRGEDTGAILAVRPVLSPPEGSSVDGQIFLLLMVKKSKERGGHSS